MNTSWCNHCGRFVPVVKIVKSGVVVLRRCANCSELIVKPLADPRLVGRSS